MDLVLETEVIRPLHIGRKIVNLFWIFGLERLIHEWPNDRLTAVLRETESQVYGNGGLAGFERESPPELDRLLRRSIAQFLATRATHQSALGLIIRDFFYLIFLSSYCLYLPLITLLNCRRPPRRRHRNVVIYHYPYLFELVKDIWPRENTSFIRQPSAYFSLEDICFLLRCVGIYPRLLIYPHFLFSLIKWVSLYSGIIQRHRPKVILNFIEGSFVSSILTGYLREKGIKHINHMHGEIFPNPRLAYSEFDLFIVYGEFWKHSFISLKCKSEFVVARNAYYRHLYDINKHRRTENGCPLCCLIIHNQLLNPRTKHYDMLCRLIPLILSHLPIYVRLHPNEMASGLRFYSALCSQFKKPQCCIDIDPCQNDPIAVSLASASIAIGRTTAGLFQAWVAGCKVIYLDDASNLKARYQDSLNILFLNQDTPAEVIEQFISTPPAQNPQETRLIDHVAKVC